jgi:predicted 3-demethylubiquinone-9 3-methyltransferase (glyoxalase superfamily)
MRNPADSIPADRVGIGPSRARVYLQELIAEGKIVAEGTNRNRTYRIKSRRFVIREDKSMNKAYPFFMFTNCKAEEAINFYASVFKDVKIENLERWADDSPAGPVGRIRSVFFTIKGATFRFMDSEGHAHGLTPSTSIFVSCDDEAELRKAHTALLDGGFELMPLGAYPFAKLYAWVQDKFGLTWQLSFA